MKVAVQRWGNSLAVRIPKAIAVESDLNDGVFVDLKLVGGKVVLVPLRVRRYNLGALLAKVKADNLHHEAETGNPVGKEPW
ncbi:MAG: AbrB/MazE/SpoVT family DNA-binding domain-containing protein [Acidobacteria bacterium]|nr:AbrB/MazE/SpoVT family DNA-binding domain-containing protein [Acidobacteriota bacterium]